MSYDRALAWLYDRGRFGVEPGLERIQALLDVLDVDPPERTVLVAGTNGKGTTVQLLADALSEAGLVTGRYVSPHVHRFTERVTVDGREIPREAVVEFVADAPDLIEAAGIEATFFELATALALAHFDASGCDAAVLEVGLGGRLDATNVVDPDLAVVTDVALDHQDVLGGSIEDIAEEKAGVMRPGAACLTAATGRARDVLAGEAEAVGAELLAVDVDRVGVADRAIDGWTWTLDDRTVRTRLCGDHHAANLLVAVEAARRLADVDAEAFADAVAGTRLPARFDVLADGPVVADGAHNPAAARALAATWQALDLPAATVVLGLIAGKDADGIVDALAPHADRFVVTAPEIPRRMPPDELRTVLADHGHAMDVVTSTAEALQPASGPRLATGSFFTAGEAIRAFRDTEFDPLIAL